ncbi:hypothetical protein Taro_040865 [Colocasia esculenta]|uniref:Uncharacterized protein n=1 Tax=Colocasia esculenta TaxID=4460 RepID=A0A843WVR3_COLES|nr:hypothetical protein [Colocasia esculenta]
MEFLLYNSDRVLRAGGLLWLDHFFYQPPDLDAVYTPMIGKLGYRTSKWTVGNKTDSSGVRNGEVYLTALLQKPVGNLRGCFSNGLAEALQMELISDNIHLSLILPADIETPGRATGQSLTIGLSERNPSDPLLLGESLDLGEGFPNTGLKLASTENQEESSFGGFLGLPKESFINLFDPFEDLFRGKYPIHFVHELGVKSSCRQDLQSTASDLSVHLLERPDTAVKFFNAEQFSRWYTFGGDRGERLRARGVAWRSDAHRLSTATAADLPSETEFLKHGLGCRQAHPGCRQLLLVLIFQKLIDGVLQWLSTDGILLLYNKNEVEEVDPTDLNYDVLGEVESYEEEKCTTNKDEEDDKDEVELDIPSASDDEIDNIWFVKHIVVAGGETVVRRGSSSSIALFVPSIDQTDPRACSGGGRGGGTRRGSTSSALSIRGTGSQQEDVASHHEGDKRETQELQRPPSFRKVFERTHKRKGTDVFVNKITRSIAESYDKHMTKKYAEDMSNPELDPEAWVVAMGQARKGQLYGFEGSLDTTVVMSSCVSSGTALCIHDASLWREQN